VATAAAVVAAMEVTETTDRVAAVTEVATAVVIARVVAVATARVVTAAAAMAATATTVATTVVTRCGVLSQHHIVGDKTGSGRTKETIKELERNDARILISLPLMQ
jgi:LytS/YehU family sensor histidine kinase